VNAIVQCEDDCSPSDVYQIEIGLVYVSITSISYVVIHNCILLACPLTGPIPSLGNINLAFKLSSVVSLSSPFVPFTEYVLGHFPRTQLW
jgi:hypothetical protein